MAGAGIRVLVLGAGAMGWAIVKDMVESSDVSRVGVADIDEKRLQRCRQLARSRVTTFHADVTDTAALVKLMQEFDAVSAALLHKHSLIAIRAAISAGVSLVDLVGSRVDEKMAMHDEASARNIAIIPGAGVAPGLSNVLVARGASFFDEPEAGTVYVGGLPLHPRPPLGYNIVFAIETVLNSCVEPARVLRGGQVAELPALSQVEEIDFPEPPGRCECFVTDGLATLTHTMRRRGMKELTEKTVRYPGYAEKIRFLIDCGLFDLAPVETDGAKIVPRRALAQVLTTRLGLDDGQDLTAMRVIVKGNKAGRPGTYRCDMVDCFDPATGMTSMARTTAYPCGIITRAIAKGEIRAKGIVPVEDAVDSTFFEKLRAGLAAKGIVFNEQVSWEA